MIFFLMISSLRAQQRLSAEQVSRTVREAQGLMNDIRQELSASGNGIPACRSHVAENDAALARERRCHDNGGNRFARTTGQ